MKLDTAEQKKRYISWCEAMTLEHLIPVEVKPMPAAEFAEVEPFVYPKFCYANALHTGLVQDDCNTVVLGAAIVMGCVVAEHAWVKRTNGEYIDPTYQKLGTLDDAEYFSLLELSVEEYKQAGLDTVGFPVDLEMYYFRKSPDYKHLFKRTVKNFPMVSGGALSVTGRASK